METGINSICDDNLFSIDTEELFLKNRMFKLAEEYPDEVKIVKFPEEGDTNLIARFPKKWLKIYPPKKITDEQREAMSERLKAVRSSKRTNHKDSAEQILGFAGWDE